MDEQIKFFIPKKAIYNYLLIGPYYSNINNIILVLSDNLVIIITPQPLLAGAETWTFTKTEKGLKSANNQNSFESWTPLRVMLLD